MSVDPNELRKEFAKVKKEYFKSHLEICEKCYSNEDFNKKKRIELHHKIPLIEGGTNDFDNLIPLCHDCHREWHFVEGLISWEDFLNSPSYREFIALFTQWENIKKYFKDKPFQDGAAMLEESISSGRRIRKEIAFTNHNEDTAEAKKEKEAKEAAAAAENGIQLRLF